MEKHRFCPWCWWSAALHGMKEWVSGDCCVVQVFLGEGGKGGWAYVQGQGHWGSALCARVDDGETWVGFQVG